MQLLKQVVLKWMNVIRRLTLLSRNVFTFVPVCIEIWFWTVCNVDSLLFKLRCGLCVVSPENWCWSRQMLLPRLLSLGSWSFVCIHACVPRSGSPDSVIVHNQGTVIISPGILTRQHFTLYGFIQATFIYTVLRAVMLQEWVGDGD